MRIRRLTATVVLLLVTPAASFAGEESRQCIDIVKECFGHTGSERDTCFKTVSTNPHCSDSETSKLAAKRAEMSALVPDDADVGPSLLGPDLVDRQCIKNFDSTWMATLVKGLPSAETSSQLQQSLQACAKKSASDVMRP
ncbi:MAG: hypothetical protein RL326_1722 [Pseudomonadota bacterium]|jgi:hypothetical protein